MMPFDDGSLTADRAQSSAMGLVVNYAEPLLASGAAVFGLGLLVLPLLAKLNDLDSGVFSYEQHGETNKNQKLRLFTEAELRQRLGLLDPSFLEADIVRNTEDMDEYMSSRSTEQLDAEVARIQKWREVANANLKGLQKRSALAFLGLPPDATDTDISKMYKKMALELHPDKGGDPEKFQELQEMRERLNEMEADDKKSEEERAEEEMAKKAEKQKEEEEEEERQRLAPDERTRKLRMEVHDNIVRLWERAKKSREEISTDKAKASNAQPALGILRLFVERFVNNELRTLRHDDPRGADARFRKFVKQGVEIIAVAAMSDVQSTLQTISMQFNYKLVARSGSKEIHGRCQALLQAIAEVPAQCERFVQQLEDALASGRDRERREKELRAAAQREREARGDYGGEAPARQAPPQAPQGPQAPKGPTAPKGPAEDPFGDFDFGARPPETLARGPEESLRTRSPPRTWDPAFDHPYAGALKANGQGVYCRPCQRWIATCGFDAGAFFSHVEKAHPSPPLGWSTAP